MTRTAGTAGYWTIANRLRAAIERGDYPPGTMLKKQEHLAEDFGVNLGTVRRAVNQLHAEGLVDPTPGYGTVVRDRDVVRLGVNRYAKARPGFGPWETACEEQGLKGHTEVTEVGWLPADRIIARELEVPEGEHVVRRRNLMRANGVVMQVQETWLPAKVAAGTPLERPGSMPRNPTGGGVYGALTAAGFAPVSVVESVFARMPTAREAELLGLPLGGGCPVTDSRRTTRDANGLVVVHTHVVVGGHVSFVYPQTLPAPS